MRSLVALGLAGASLAGCGCEGRAFTLRRGDSVVAQGCAEVADTAAARSVGLIGRAPLPDGWALWMEFPMVTEACVTNGGVGFAIVAAWTSAAGVVTAVERYAAGETPARCHDGALRVLEWSAAYAPDVRAGDRLAW